MGKAKTASKNNPTARLQARKYTYDGKEIRPVKLISQQSTYFAAEFEGTGKLVIGADNKPLPWSKAKEGK